MSEYEYFRVEKCPEIPGHKTREYRVVSASHGCILGWIRWYSSWRQYCFFPAEATIWSAGCLADVQDFLKQLADLRRAKLGS